MAPNSPHTPPQVVSAFLGVYVKHALRANKNAPEYPLRDVSPFILCGGSGTRLWPLSREALPKQFHKIAWEETLFQQTCRRLTGDLFNDPVILSNQHYRFLVAEQLEGAGIKPAGIVLEPVGRNTAPAACIAALLASRSHPDALVLLAPSDHMIPDAAAFARAVSDGVSAAKEGAFVVFGIEPDCPHTGYGYIETEKGNSRVLKVRRFVEKPSREAANEFIDAGNFYWNAGIFLFKAATLIELFEDLAPEILDACRDSAARDDGRPRLFAPRRQLRNGAGDLARLCRRRESRETRCVPPQYAVERYGLMVVSVEPSRKRQQRQCRPRRRRNPSRGDEQQSRL